MQNISDIAFVLHQLNEIVTHFPPTSIKYPIIKKQIPQAQGACKNVVLLKLTEQIVNICTVQVNEFPFIVTFTLYNVLLVH